MPTLRLFGGTKVRSLPSIWIFPVVGNSNPAIIRRVVVLPQPLGPKNETNSPCSSAQIEIIHRDRFCKFFVYI